MCNTNTTCDHHQTTVKTARENRNTHYARNRHPLIYPLPSTRTVLERNNPVYVGTIESALAVLLSEVEPLIYSVNNDPDSTTSITARPHESVYPAYVQLLQNIEVVYQSLTHAGYIVHTIRMDYDGTIIITLSW